MTKTLIRFWVLGALHILASIAGAEPQMRISSADAISRLEIISPGGEAVPLRIGDTHTLFPQPVDAPADVVEGVMKSLRITLPVDDAELAEIWGRVAIADAYISLRVAGMVPRLSAEEKETIAERISQLYDVVHETIVDELGDVLPKTIVEREMVRSRTLLLSQMENPLTYALKRVITVDEVDRIAIAFADRLETTAPRANERVEAIKRRLADTAPEQIATIVVSEQTQMLRELLRPIETLARRYTSPAELRELDAEAILPGYKALVGQRAERMRAVVEEKRQLRAKGG